MARWIGTYAGVPPSSEFGTTRGEGTPLVVNTVTGILYYLSESNVVTPVGGVSFPVGAVYVTISPTNPASTLGYGTWTAFGVGRTLIGVDVGNVDFDTVEETGGSLTQTFSI